MTLRAVRHRLHSLIAPRRDVRTTPFVETLARDVRYACRTFARAPMAALTIVTTVALGLGLVAVVFTFYNALFLRADDVRKPGELFEVRRPPSPGARNVWIPFRRPQYEALRRETGVFADVFAMIGEVGTRVEGRALSGTLVSGNFFQALGVGATLGRPLTPADDEPSAGRPVIVLSHRGWTKLFKGDAAAVGSTLRLNGVPYEIVGVMPRRFRGLTVVPPDFWAPLVLVDRFRRVSTGNDDDVAVEVVGRLGPGMSADAATAALTAWAGGSADLQVARGGPATIRLIPRQGTVSADAVEGLLRFAPLFFAFGLILLIACGNVANLLLARGVSRQREIGVRLSLGATRGQIVRQLLTESLLLALLSAACGLAISRLVLEIAVGLAATTISPGIADLVSVAAPAVDWRVAIFLLCGAIASTAFFGLLPALHATRVELVRAMRGELTRDARPGLARGALIALQVGASALLLICSAVFLRGAFAAATADPGARIDDVVILELANEPLRAAMVEAVRTDPAVAAFAASWPGGLGGALAEASSSSITVPLEYKFISPEYFGLLDIQVVRGRAFGNTERSAAAGVAVVSETTARRLWPNHDAVGQAVNLKTFRPSGTGRLGAEPQAPALPFNAFTIVGVVRDVRTGVGMFEMYGAGLYLPVGPEVPGTSLVLRVHGDPEQARQQLTGRLTKIDPAMGEIWTLKTIAAMGTSILTIAFWLTAVLGGLALVLTLSGIFSVLSYVVEQRRQEIGVRMALGATGRNVTWLVLAQSARPVAVGLIAGALFAGALATVLMTTSAASRIGAMVRVFDPVAYAASLLCIVTACLFAAMIPALRATRIDPMTTLRQE